MSYRIATTRLIDGVIAVGETITISTLLWDSPVRDIYTGVIIFIGVTDVGNTTGYLAVVGQAHPIQFLVEQETVSEI